MLYLLSALSVMYILLMYCISLLLLPPDGFILCYIGLLVLTLWRFDDDVISPSPGTGRYSLPLNRTLPCLSIDHLRVSRPSVILVRVAFDSSSSFWASLTWSIRVGPVARLNKL